jgi:uncharacterized damage-inducible protein DinB
MEALAHYRMLAHYNRVANERLYERCAQLEEEEYRRQRKGSFGSIHALLNHILLGDRIWMARFQGGGQTTPPLSTILYDDFPSLRGARTEEDRLIEDFFARLSEGFFDRSLEYTNSLGQHCVDPPSVAVTHLFNHQTHHRGQVHVMLSQTTVAPPSLDLHRIVNPV